MPQFRADVVEILHEMIGAVEPEIRVAPELCETALDVGRNERTSRGCGAPQRVGPAAATLIQQDDVSSISYSVYDLNSATPSTPIAGPTSVTVATAVFDTLQDWTLDSVGYNLSVTLPAAVTANRGTATLWVVLTITLTGGTVFYLRFELLVETVVP